MRREVYASGKINENGKLSVYMGEVKEMCADNKGRRVIARFTVTSSEPSAAMRGYYFHYIVPVMRQAIWETGERLTEEETEKRLRELSPVMREETPNEKTGRYTYRLREIDELDTADLLEHIETIKAMAAEWYCVFIEDPRYW